MTPTIGELPLPMPQRNGAARPSPWRDVVAVIGLAIGAAAAAAQTPLPTAQPLAQAPQGPRVLTFEDFTTAGPGEGGQVRLTTQYPGVSFNSPSILDYSKALAVPGFAHSGTRAIVVCLGIEFCGDTTFQIHFAEPQQRVRVWAGVSGRHAGPVSVTLLAFDSNGSQVDRGAAVIATNAPARIETPLEVRSDANRIMTVTIAAQGAFVSDLAIDDVEFEQAAPPPPPPPPPSLVLVPDVTGRSMKEAERMLERVGLGVGMQAQVRETGPVGTIYSQYPPAGDSVQRGDLINLNFIVGPPPPPPPFLLIAIVIAVVGGAAMLVRKLRKPRQRDARPATRLEPRLAHTGLDRQKATVKEAAPLGLEIRLRIRPESLRKWRYDD